MLVTHSIWITTYGGERLLPINPALSKLDATLIMHGVGKLSLTASAKQVPVSYLQRDRMIQIWRKVPLGSAAMWSTYRIRRWRYSYDHSGKEIVQIEGYCPNHYLVRRTTAAFAGTPETTKTGPADDVLKEIVAEAFANTGAVPPTYGTREIENLTVANDLSAAGSITKGFAWKPLLTLNGTGTLVEIVNDLKSQHGEDLFWQVRPVYATSTDVMFEFRTGVGQLGVDISDYVVFTPQLQNLVEPYADYDYSREVTYVYVAGKNEGTDRDVVQVWNQGREIASPGNRHELSVDARNTDYDGLEDVGYQALGRGSPVIRTGGKLVDTQAAVFGRDWNFGDKIGVLYGGYNRAVVTAVTLHIENARENITALIRGET